MEFTLKEIIQATGAKIIKNEGVNDLKFTFSTDTRTIKKGEIYLPLKGENFNGEDFIDKALEAGAGGFFCTKKSSQIADIILQVDDTLTAYLQLANFYKNKINPRTVAITGSCGKTTTKEMAYCVAKEKFKTHKSELNFNNEIGLCKTILSMPEDTQVLIVEMGMRGLGEIELLSKYAQPDIAIITNIGTAHIGRLGSRENIAKAKCEITSHLKESGLLIAHDDDLIKQEIGCEDAKRPRSVEGKNSHASTHPHLLPSQTLYFSLKNTKIIKRTIGFSKFEYKNFEYELNIEGDYNIENSIAVIEAGLALGMKEKEIASGLKKYSPIEKRWEVKEIKGYKIINDSYNANPDSMKATIKTVLDNYPEPILFVLGDMGELGENEIEYHRQIGEFLIQSIKSHCERSEAIQTTIITVGKLANEITKVLEQNGIKSENFDDNLQTSRYILDNVKLGTTIVLKASRSMKFEEIVREVTK